jgi:GDPmannose 4,6-dehydratase
MPDYFVNCAAMSHVGESWKIPEATCNITGVGVLRCLEAIRKYNKECIFVQLSSSEMFGHEEGGKINEKTKLSARSPYGAAKILGHQLVNVYRESYGIKAYSAICFNYESEKRGADFITRKITKGMADIFTGKIDKIRLGNLNFVRDWGYADDYAEAIFKMLYSNKPDDYIVATGKMTTGREFIDKCFNYANQILSNTIYTENMFSFNKHIETRTQENIRPNDLIWLCGDNSKIVSELGWTPKYTIDMIVKKMLDFDFKPLINERLKFIQRCSL